MGVTVAARRLLVKQKGRIQNDCQACERMATAESKIESVEKNQDDQLKYINKVDERLDGLRNWIMAAAVGAVANLFIGIIIAVVGYLMKK